MADQGIIRGDPVELRVRGERLVEWESVSIVQALNAAAGKFTLEVFPRYGQPLPVRPQDPVELWFAGEKLVDGHAYKLQVTQSEKRSEVLSVSGRDKAADMVDSSVTEEPLEFLELSLRQLAERLAAPFDVPVRFPDDPPAALELPFDEFKVSPGERAWQALERACRLRGLLCSPGGDGGILLQSPAATRAEGHVAEGVNAKSLSLTWDDTRRFQTYIVRGQGSGSDEAFGSLVAQVEGQAVDGLIGRPRQLLILAEGAVDDASARKRAQWEASVRAARAERIMAVVPGWRQQNRPDSRVWRVNELVPVSWPSRAFEDELLVDQVSRRSDGNGKLTELVLVRPDAYQAQAVVDPSASLFFDS